MIILKSLFCLAFLLQNIETLSVERADEIIYRLPTNVRPSHYSIQLTLGHPDTISEFNGIINITFKATEPNINEILIHGNQLTIVDGTTLISTANWKLVPLDPTNTFRSDNNTDLISIKTVTPLTVNTQYILNITYTGKLRDDEMYGFYKSVYKNAKGQVKALATTQFQPTYARRAFPCFDEPSFKAQFDIVLIYPKRYNARGNTEGTTVDLDANNKKSTFAITPLMSTYLIAFIVSEFTVSNGGNAETDGIPHMVWSREEAVGSRQLALNFTPKIVQYMGSYTGIPYSASTITKIDQVAIPDFAAGAMENWGLITYRETALLWNETESSNRYKQRVQTVIAHELAHMWFGNLKTTSWWSETFLNEGFATYFEFFSTGRVEPSWELDKQFVVEELHSALVSDASKSSHALSHEVNSSAQVSGRFDTISYAKGGSILRMVENIIGSGNFQSGIQEYISTNQFGVTNSSVLWEIFGKHSANLPNSISLSEVMANWTSKPGYPLVTVRASGNDVTLTQTRFLTTRTGPADPTTWYVPISYTTENDSKNSVNTAPTKWITPATDLKISKVLDKSSWILINNQQTGFYRVKYDDILLGRLAVGLAKNDFDNIPDLNRANFVDDLMNLARIGEYEYSKVFEVITFLKKDDSYYPWYAAFVAFNNMLRRTGDDNIRASLSTYIYNLMPKLLARVPFGRPQDDNQIYTHTRVLAQTWACNLNNQACIDSSLEAYAKYKSNPKVRPDKNMRTIIYCNALKYSKSPEDDWNFLWKEYENTDLATEQVTIISALGCTTDTTLLTKYLKKTITENSGIRKQDALSVFSAVHSGSLQGIDVAFQFLTENYQAVKDNYKSLNSMSSLISGIVGKFNKQSQIDALETFISAINDDDVKISARDALASAKTNLEWTNSFEKQMTQYFKLDHADSIKFEFFTSIALVLAVYNLFY